MQSRSDWTMRFAGNGQGERLYYAFRHRKTVRLLNLRQSVELWNAQKELTLIAIPFFFYLPQHPKKKSKLPSQIFQLFSGPANDHSTYTPAHRKRRCIADVVTDNSTPSNKMVIYPCPKATVQIRRFATGPLNPKTKPTPSLTTLATSSWMLQWIWPKQSY